MNFLELSLDYKPLPITCAAYQGKCLQCQESRVVAWSVITYWAALCCLGFFPVDSFSLMWVMLVDGWCCVRTERCQSLSLCHALEDMHKPAQGFATDRNCLWFYGLWFIYEMGSKNNGCSFANLNWKWYWMLIKFWKVLKGILWNFLLL